MSKLSIEMENCFGIECLNKIFDFEKKNTYAIYARNGLMKTSFAKTFKKIQDNKAKEIRDEIFDIKGYVKATLDDKNLSKDEIFVIQSYESEYESKNISSLLVNEDLKTKITSVLNLKSDFLKILEKYSGLKLSKTSQGRKVYELEPALVKDLSFIEKSFLLNVSAINLDDIDTSYSSIRYSDIFDETILKKIKSDEFQEHIIEFMKKNDEIYSEYDFFAKGRFTLPKLKDVKTSLLNNNYFVRDNKLVLSGTEDVFGIDYLNSKIEEIESKLKETSSLKAIESMLSDTKGKLLRDLLDNNPHLILELKASNLEVLKSNLWLSYLKAEESNFKNLRKQYESLEKDIEQIDTDNTPWREALDIFESRFSVPYKMEVVNMKSSIIGDNIPKIEFSFYKDGTESSSGDKISLNRNELEEKDILSQGEKRALYLLNIIFDIEKKKKEHEKDKNKKTIFIVDDIADSFDYKNKYAIIEYLYEMAQVNGFYLIILSHNFDFYRTVSSRLSVPSDNRLNAELSGEIVRLEKEKYQKQPFKFWKMKLTKKHLIALIPFTRNLVEFGNDNHITQKYGFESDYSFLTELLHQKKNTNKITAQMLSEVFEKYLGNGKYDKHDSIDTERNICDILFQAADSITLNDIDLENKIILSLAARHKAEKFMISKLENHNSHIVYKGNSLTAKEYLQKIEASKNQTRELYNGYIQIGNTSEIKILDQVNIMTPENIHINSFMYEPIQDMDIHELLSLYLQLKELM